MHLTKKTHWQLCFAAHVLRMGGVIAHPTEAVWGLACDPFNPEAVNRLLRIKQRPVEKGLILVSGQVSHFDRLLKPLSGELRSRFTQRTPSPTTWLVPDESNSVPAYIKGEHRPVALRLTEHVLFSELSRIFGQPLVSTSANPAGKDPATNLFQVNQYFSREIDYALPGKLGAFSKPSQIRDLVSDTVLRS